jgi:hypothetical protein
VDLPASALSTYAEPRAFSTYGEPRTRWRTAAIVTAAIAALELVALAIVALAFIAKPFADDQKPASAKAAPAATGKSGTTGQSTAARKAPPPPAVARLPRVKTPVLVLNGNGVSGAAATAAERIATLHYPISGIADASRRDFPRTIVMYRPGLRGEAERLARDLGLRRERAVPLDGMRPAELGRARLALILGG